jgi:hypothetical protein
VGRRFDKLNVLDEGSRLSGRKVLVVTAFVVSLCTIMAIVLS